MATTPQISPDQRDAAARALGEVKRLSRVEGRAISYPGLNQALDPLRDLTLGCGCGNCLRNPAWYRSRSLAWCALDNASAFVAAFQKRRSAAERRGGIRDCSDPDPSPMGRAMGAWLELAESGETSVTLVDVRSPGYPIRLRITCPKCKAEHITTNTERLRLFLTAIARGESRMWLSN